MNKNRLFMHMKKVVSHFEARPVLQCVNYNKNGNLYATDSHVAVRVNGFHDGQNEFSFNMFSMKVTDATYPDVERLMDVPEIICEAEFAIPSFMRAIKPFTEKSRLTPSVKMTIGNNLMIIESVNNSFDEELKVEFPISDIEGEIVISANPVYILQALEFARDADAGIPAKEKKKNGVVRVKFGSPIRPFMFTVGDYDYLVTPQRTY